MSVLRVRHRARVNPSCPGWDTTADDDEVTFVPLEAVWPKRLDLSRRKSKGETSVGYTRFCNEDVVIPKITPTFEADRSTIVLGLPTAIATGTTELHVVRPGPDLDGRYVDYLFSTAPFLRGGAAEMIGVAGQKRVPDTWIRDFAIPLTDRSEQRAVADYLDTETARIDALIAKKQRLVQALDERVGAMAVELTRGSPECTNSTIATIPATPHHWRVLRNKVFMREINDPSISGTEELLTVSHLTGVTPRSEKTVYMFEAESTVGYKRIRRGDLAINTMWAWMGAAGVAPIDGIVSPAYGVYRIDTAVVAPEWFDLVVRTKPYIVEMTRFSRGVTSSRLRLYPDEFLRMSCPVPPFAEQKARVGQFEAYRTTVRRAVDSISRQVELLSEHRQALITAAVTGEHRVPGG